MRNVAINRREIWPYNVIENNNNEKKSLKKKGRRRREKKENCEKKISAAMRSKSVIMK
jgi:hypothetical protein